MTQEYKPGSNGAEGVKHDTNAVRIQAQVAEEKSKEPLKNPRHCPKQYPQKRK